MKNAVFWVLAFIAIGLLIYLNFFRKESTASVPEVIFTPEAPKPIGPYSQAICRGNAVFVSGQIAIDPVLGKMDTANIEFETHRVLKNIRAILAAAQLDMNDVVKSTVYLTNLGTFGGMNKIYGEYFTSNPPARETVQVSALPKGAHIEISVIAIRK